jgi:hypothetical protein
VTDPQKTTPAEAQPAPVHADFLKPALAKIKANLELLLGKGMEIAPGEPAPVTAEALKARLPASCVVLGVKASGAVDAPLFCILPEQLAVAMSLIAQLKPPSAVQERLAVSVGLDPKERDGVKEVASFILAALGDFAKDSTGGRIVLAPAEPRFLPGDESDLSTVAGDCVALEGTVTIESVSPMPLTLVVPTSLADAWSAPPPAGPSIFGAKAERPPSTPLEAKARPATAAPRAAAAAAPRAAAPPPPPAAGAGPAAAWVAGGPVLAETVRGALGEAFDVRAFGAFPELLAAVNSEPPPALVVVEVPRGSEFELDLVAALRRHPSLAGSGLVVLLEDACRKHVLRCGALGLLDVIPPGLETDVLAERLLGRARKMAAGRHR